METKFLPVNRISQADRARRAIEIREIVVEAIRSHCGDVVNESYWDDVRQSTTAFLDAIYEWQNGGKADAVQTKALKCVGSWFVAVNHARNLRREQ